MPVTAVEARASLASAGLTPPMRRVDDIPDVIVDMTTRPSHWLFNVAPWELVRELGSQGRFTIPACPEGRDYSEPLVLPQILLDFYPVDPETMKTFQSDGKYISDQILGVGKMLDGSQSYVRQGAFYSATATPSKEAVAEAKRKLHGYMAQLVQEMNDAMAQGPEAARQTRSERHLTAARYLKKTVAECPWLKDMDAPETRAECPACSMVYKVGTVICRGCNYILDEKKHAAMAGRFAK